MRCATRSLTSAALLRHNGDAREATADWPPPLLHDGEHPLGVLPYPSVSFWLMVCVLFLVWPSLTYRVYVLLFGVVVVPKEAVMAQAGAYMIGGGWFRRLRGWRLSSSWRPGTRMTRTGRCFLLPLLEFMWSRCPSTTIFCARLRISLLVHRIEGWAGELFGFGTMKFELSFSFGILECFLR
jgi:hypothetical protein